MKTSIAIFLLSLSLIGCDIKMLSSPQEEPDNPVILPNDADFISLTGERYEKYKFRLDPAIYNKVHTITGEASNNSISFSASYRDLLVAESFETTLTGTLRYQYSYTHSWGSQSGSGSENVSGYLNTTLNKKITLTAIANPLYEEYDIVKPFQGDSLTLPLTGVYSNAYDEYKYHTYIPSYVFSAATLVSYAPVPLYNFPPDNWNEGGAGHGTTNKSISPAVSNIPVSLETFDRYILASRDFYQYKHFTVRYQSDLVIHGFEPKPMPHPIVETISHDRDKNEITVVFKDYNTPYSGPLFSYWIEAEDGTWREKTVSIE